MQPVPRHRCMIYEGSPENHLPWLAAQFVRQLDLRARCIYLNSPDMVGAVNTALRNAGIDVPAEIRRGNIVLASDQTHLSKGHFDAARMLDMLGEHVTSATYDGHPSIWIVGDMSWEFGDHTNLTELLKYERALEERFQTYPALSGLCQYHRDTLPAQAVQEGLCSHQAVYLNETLFHINPYFTQTPEPCSGHIPTDIDDLLERFRRNG